MASALTRLALAAAAGVCLSVCSAAAAAAPAAGPTAPDGSRIDRMVSGPGRVVDLSVHSAATDTMLDVRVLRAPHPDAPAPALYLLNGAAGGGDGSNWFDRTDIRTFFADKQVTIVVPSGGAASFFTDWERADPVLGKQKWATFLTRELPPLIDATFHGTGRNAVAGISMAGTSAFQLPLAAPGLYRAAAAYSACPMTSDAVGRAFVTAIVEGRGHGNTANMWGPPSDPAWTANDPYHNAARLRGLALYESNGTGAPGPFDTLNGPGIQGDPEKLVDQLVIGAVIETTANRCAHAFARRLATLNVPATFVFRPYGTHSWGYWEQDLHDSWARTIAPAIA